MAKKKTSTKATSMSMQDSLSHPLQTVYRLLFLLGVAKGKDDVYPRYEGADYSLSIALPLIKYGIAFEGDETNPLEEDGWHIEHLAYKDIEAFSRVFLAVDNSRIAEMYSRADPNVKNTSFAEEKLLMEMKRRNLPEPDRNYRFTKDDGTELTVPDFTWENLRIVFFMDGSYWHSVKGDQAIVKELKKNKKMSDEIISRRKDKVRKDGYIRSQLSSRGWLVLSCTDDDLETKEGLKEVVDMISDTMRNTQEARALDMDDEGLDDTLSMID